MPKAGKITHKLHSTAIKMDKCTDFAKICRYSSKMHKLQQRALKTLHSECRSPPSVHWLCLYSAMLMYGIPVNEIDFSLPQKLELAPPVPPQQQEKVVDVDDEFSGFLDEATDGAVAQFVQVAPITNVMTYDGVLREQPPPEHSVRKPPKERKRRPRLPTPRQLAAAEKEAHNMVLAQRAVDPLYTESDNSELSF